MKAVIKNKTYTSLGNISFSPDTDITGNRTPINKASVEIITIDNIAVGQYMFLYDDANTLFVKYWIVYAERINKNTVSIDCQSGLILLERDIKDPVMYTEEPVTDVLDDLFETLGGSSGYVLDSSLQSATITGFCPEQSAKTRLQWVCFAIAAYVKDSFCETIEIKSVSTTATLIPMEKTFWRPSVTYNDYVTAVSITAFSFEQGTPSSTDEWVDDWTDTYIVTRQRHKLNNPDAPQDALEHVIHFDDIMLINSDNVAAMLSFFSTHYFKRMEVEADVVNNGTYKPGDCVMIYTDPTSIVKGYIDSADFSFGVQTRSRLKLTPVEEVECATLTVTCEFAGNTEIPKTVLSKKEYVFPVGYVYQITNLYFDCVFEEHRYVFRPTTDEVTGTMPSDGASVTVSYAIALDFAKHKLDVISVDGITAADGVVAIT